MKVKPPLLKNYAKVILSYLFVYKKLKCISHKKSRLIDITYLAKNDENLRDPSILARIVDFFKPLTVVAPIKVRLG